MVLKRKVVVAPVINEVKVPAPRTEASKSSSKSLCDIHDKYYAKKSKAKKVEEKVVKAIAVKKEIAEKVKKPTIDDIWYKILHESVGTNRTDKIIAEMMEKACPGHKYTEASVAGHRSGYNCGKYSTQKGVKPAVRLKKFVAKSI